LLSKTEKMGGRSGPLIHKCWKKVKGQKGEERAGWILGEVDHIMVREN